MSRPFGRRPCETIKLSSAEMRQPGTAQVRWPLRDNNPPTRNAGIAVAQGGDGREFECASPRSGREKDVDLRTARGVESRPRHVAVGRARTGAQGIAVQSIRPLAESSHCRRKGTFGWRSSGGFSTAQKKCVRDVEAREDPAKLTTLSWSCERALPSFGIPIKHALLDV